jgi:hypothetical protein
MLRYIVRNSALEEVPVGVQTVKGKRMHFALFQVGVWDGVVSAYGSLHANILSQSAMIECDSGAFRGYPVGGLGICGQLPVVKTLAPAPDHKSPATGASSRRDKRVAEKLTVGETLTNPIL